MTAIKILDRQIGELTARLRALKKQRKSLKARAKMLELRRDADFLAKISAGQEQLWADPERRRQQSEAMRAYNQVLPWAPGTPERTTYRRLLRNGISREVAIEEVMRGHISSASATLPRPPGAAARVVSHAPGGLDLNPFGQPAEPLTGHDD